VKSGQLRALGVATTVRSPIAPEVPPISDTVDGFDLRPWWGLTGPAGMPEPIVTKLHDVTNEILNDPDVQARLLAQGVIITPMTTEGFNRFVVTEIAKWSKIVKDSGAQAD